MTSMDEGDGQARWLVRELNHIQSAVQETNRKIDSIVLAQISELHLKVATLEAEAAVYKASDYVTKAEFRAEVDPIKKLFWTVITVIILAVVVSVLTLLGLKVDVPH